MKHTFISVLAAFLISSPALADTFTMGPPEKVGLSSERLQRLTSALKAEVEKGRLPGAVLAIARKGQLAYFETLGYRDAATKAPMPRDAIFSIASMTKPMVSVAIMMLHDEGKLFLSDPVGKFLPQLAKMQVGIVKADASWQGDGRNRPGGPAADHPGPSAPHLWHYLRRPRQTRGPQDCGRLLLLFVRDLHEGRVHRHLSKAPLLYQPGTVWDYSLSTDVLGLVVEAISGKSLGAFLEERIWKPLGMVDTSFTVPDAKRARYALAFPNDPLTNKPQSVLHASGKPLKFECGGGCAVSTTMDYLRFAQMLLNGGVLDGNRILSRKTVELMTADQLAPEVKAAPLTRCLLPGQASASALSVRTHAGLAPLAGTAAITPGRGLRHLLLD